MLGLINVKLYGVFFKMKKLCNQSCFKVNLLFFCLLTNFCGAQTNGLIDTTSCIELRISPRMALSVDTHPEDIFNAVEYLPLESNKKSLFNSIDQLEITEDYYVILDKQTSVVNNKSMSSILLFKKDGKFHTRITRPMTEFFTINRYQKEIFAYDFMFGKLDVYNYDGEFLRENKCAFHFETFVYTSVNSVFAFRNSYFSNSKDVGLEDGFKFSNLILTDIKFKPHKKYFPFDSLHVSRQDIWPGNINYFSYSGNNLFFHQPYFNEIFQIKDDVLLKKFKFIFPLEQSLPINFASDVQYFKKRIDHLRKFTNQFYDISDFYQVGNLITFQLFSLKNRNVFFYDLKHQVLSSLSAIITDNRLIFTSFKERVIGGDDKSIVTYEKASSFFHSETLKLIKASDNCPVALQDFVNKGSIESNPLLIKLYMKE